MKILKAILIALAVGVVSAPVLADQAGEAAIVAQADSDNRPATLGDINRLDGKIEDVRRDLGTRLDALEARLGGRIDTLTTAVWSLMGVIIAGLLGFIAVLIRREKTPVQALPLSPKTPASASR